MKGEHVEDWGLRFLYFEIKGHKITWNLSEVEVNVRILNRHKIVYLINRNLDLHSDGLEISPRWGRQPSEGANTWFCQNFSKIALNWKYVYAWKGGGASLLPLRSAKASYYLLHIVWKLWLMINAHNGDNCDNIRIRCLYDPRENRLLT